MIDFLCTEPVDRQARFRLDAGGFNQVCPVPGTEVIQRFRKPLEVARHGNGFWAVYVGVVNHLGPVEGITGIRPCASQRIVGCCGFKWRTHAEFHDLGTAGPGVKYGHIATAADAAHPGFNDTKGETRGDRRINGIAAAPQNIGADVRGQVVLSCHQSLIGSDGGFAQLPVLLYRFCHGLMLLQWDRQALRLSFRRALVMVEVHTKMREDDECRWRLERND